MTDKPEDGWKPVTAGEVLDHIIEKTKAKADKKKAKKPTRIDAMRAKKIEQTPDGLDKATKDGWPLSAPDKNLGKSTPSPKKPTENGDIGAYPLKDKMERFCKEYLVDLNATQAAIRSGYSQKTANRIGPENLSKPVIRARLAFLQRGTMKKLDVTPERIMAEVAKIAFSNLGDFIKVQADGTGYIDLKDVTPDMFAALEQYEITELPPFKAVENGEEVVREVLKIKIKQHSKLDALEKLMRRHNLAAPMQVNHTHTGTVDLSFDEFARRMAFVLAKAGQKPMVIEHKKNDTELRGVSHDIQTGEPHG